MAAQPHAKVFIDAGLSQDFIAKLTATPDAVKTSIDTRAAARRHRSSATGTLKDLEHRARLAFKALNDFVVPILSANVAHSGLLAEWKKGAPSRLERRAGGRGRTGRAGAQPGADSNAPPSSSAPPAMATPPVSPAPA